MSQGNLFDNSEIKPERDNSFLYRQLEKLGDMMGDGLHHEEPWINKEYRRISKILMPDVHKDIRKRKADSVNEMMVKLLAEKSCKCGGRLIQGQIR